MIEDEATQTWCPKVQITYSDGWFISNRGDRNSSIDFINQCCIASECMWWVWDEDQPRTGNSNDIQGHCGATK